MKSEAKATLLSAVLLLTAQVAFAQKPLETNPLIQEPNFLKELSQHNSSDFLLKEKLLLSQNAGEKTTSVKKTSKSGKNITGYQIQESDWQDRHDGLKPRANPVPKVKILSMGVPETPEPEQVLQEPKTAQTADIIKKPQVSTHSSELKPEQTQPWLKGGKNVSKKLKVSKHFLEQQQKEQDQQPVDNVSIEQKVSKHFLEQQQKEQAQQPVDNVSIEQKVSKHFLEQQQKEQDQQPVDNVSIEQKVSKHFLEQQQKEQAQQPVDNVSIEQKVSKHFLEQQQKEQDLAENTSDSPSSSVTSDSADPEVLLSAESKIINKKIEASSPSPVKFSVIHASSKLTPKERSDFLEKEIPEDSMTKKILKKNKRLMQIFVFENKSSQLTMEMQTVLDELAKSFQETKNKRLLIYAYSAMDPDEPLASRRYALRRALAVRSYLVQKGIHSLNMEMRSFGSKGAGEHIPDRVDIMIENR